MSVVSTRRAVSVVALAKIDFLDRVSQVGYVYRTIMRPTYWLARKLLITAELIPRCYLLCLCLFLSSMRNNIASKFGVYFSMKNRADRMLLANAFRQRALEL